MKTGQLVTLRNRVENQCKERKPLGRIQKVASSLTASTTPELPKTMQLYIFFFY